MLATILFCGQIFVACSKDDNTVDEALQQDAAFQAELNQAMIWAQLYGPETQSLAEEVAARHNGKTTPINYKTKESIERKCRTDHSTPSEVRDLARTTVICEYDSLQSAIASLQNISTTRNMFGRYKHQTSNYG